MIERKLSLLAFLALAACGPVIPAGGDNFSEFRNPDPKIEALHVEAYDYDLGQNGRPKNQVKANQLYLQAAKAGDPRSMINYALNRFTGEGCKQDRVDAYQWADKARFATQHSKDLKVKWRIRGAQAEMLKHMTEAEKKAAGGYQRY